ncbi:MAG: preprotein translocase subunit SecE [Candidatus Omnitrophica bacterium]|jgi:preprotein translocase subunit SecE|nr:preprotein translocase subunit SecE [Candidatus Omnitrophota bacterium]
MFSKFKKIPQFFREIREELKKVNWSSKAELKGAVIVVICVLAFLTIYIALLDLGLSKLMHSLLQG